MSAAVEEILLRVDAGLASPSDMSALQEALQTKEGRARAVQHFMFNAALLELYQSQARNSESGRREVAQFHELRSNTAPKAPIRSHRTRRPRTERSSFLGLFLKFAAVVALVAAGAQIYQYQSGRQRQAKPAAVATLVSISGTVSDGTSGGALQKGAPINENQTVATGAESSATLLFTDGTTISLDAGSRLSKIKTTSGIHARLESGILSASVQPQASTAPLIIETPNAIATVLGTEFKLRADGTSTRLDVESGKVRLSRTSDKQSVDVAASQFALVAPGVELAAKSINPGTRQIILTPEADASVNAGASAKKNFGTAQFITVKKDAPDYTREAYVRFDLRAVTGRIVAAKLRLYCNSRGDDAFENSISFLGDVDWDEKSITWDTRLPEGGPVLSTWTPPERRSITVDLTPHVDSFGTKPSKWTFRLFATKASSNQTFCHYGARESGARGPQLILTVSE